MPSESDAWKVLRFMAEELVKLVGKPSVLARLEMPAKQAAVAAQWLRALEAWLRRLLLIAAARIAIDPPRAQHKRRPRRKASAPGFSTASEDSAGWRVSFALAERRPGNGPRRKHDRPMHRRTYSCAALAIRLEAVLRVLAQPEPLARRYARKLASDSAAPNRVFHQKIRKLGALEPYVREATLLILDAYPDAWKRVDTS